MAKLNDLTGLKFSYLYVESISNQRQNKKILWNCICKCGNKLLIKGNSLKTGNTQSCGCKKSESTIKRNKQNSKPRLNIEHCQHCNDELNDLADMISIPRPVNKPLHNRLLEDFNEKSSSKTLFSSTSSDSFRSREGFNNFSKTDC